MFKFNTIFAGCNFDPYASWGGGKFIGTSMFCNNSGRINFGFGAHFDTALIINSEFATTGGCKFLQLYLLNDSSDNINLSNIEISNVLLIKNTKANTILFDKTFLPDTIFLHEIGSIREINLNNSVYETTGRSFKRRYLYINSQDIEKLSFKYSNFKLLFFDINGNRKSDIEIASIYESLLNKFKRNNDLESYKLVDIEYKKYKDHSIFKLQSFINEWWWNFGYDRDKIIKHTILFITFFSLVIFLFIKKLQKDVYSIPRINEIEKSGEAIYSNIKKRLWYSVVYTLIIFFNFSIKIDNISLKPRISCIAGTIFILVVHLTGLICLGYIAAMIFQK